ncbi:hypothetical protein UQW22_09985 [Isoptericola halotolerans]|uniref:hypothetical protein n=1 Tax=Isoptericola halotolerans TaxID=300560 RepID=UPI00388FC56F
MTYTFGATRDRAEAVDRRLRAAEARAEALERQAAVLLARRDQLRAEVHDTSAELDDLRTRRAQIAADVFAITTRRRPGRGQPGPEGVIARAKELLPVVVGLHGDNPARQHARLAVLDADTVEFAPVWAKATGRAS